MSDDTPVPISRRFLPVPKELDTDDEQLDVSTLGLSQAKTWAALNDEYRTVILADAGAGKTHEMRIQAEALRDQGCRAFFLRIEDMADGPATALEIGTSAGAELGSGNRGSVDGNDTVVVATGRSAQDSVNQVGQQITRRNLNIQPTLTVRPGFPLRVIVNKDLVLRPYGTATRTSGVTP